jgi:hypothetical protein
MCSLQNAPSTKASPGTSKNKQFHELYLLNSNTYNEPPSKALSEVTLDSLIIL